ncbi:hypothetical protein GW17_00061085 [Ensete ventricosum]|nr:hypothetical protein GW17_00061085 [Ensete ventricosum]
MSVVFTDLQRLQKWSQKIKSSSFRGTSDTTASAKRYYRQIEIENLGLGGTTIDLGAAASKGGSVSDKGGRPSARRLSVGKGSCRLRKGDSGGIVRVREEARASFEKKTIVPLKI